MRMLEGALDGYEFCKKSKVKALRENKAEQFKQIAMGSQMISKTAIAFAPNGYVRKHLKEIDRRCQVMFGKPAPGMESIADFVLQTAIDYKKKQQTIPPAPHYDSPYVAKRYEYGSNTHDLILKDTKPYAVTYPEGLPESEKGPQLPQGSTGMFPRGPMSAGLDMSIV